MKAPLIAAGFIELRSIRREYTPLGLEAQATLNTMRALSIRQPYAELILRGIKTIEYRSRHGSSTR